MDISTFKTAVHAVARNVSAEIISIYTPTTTPNFFAAELSFNMKTLYLLSSFDGLWAFSEKFTPSECELAFVDSEILSATLSNLFGFTPLTTFELNSPYKKLADIYDADILYWKPKSLGEALFNWWD